MTVHIIIIIFNKIMMMCHVALILLLSYDVYILVMYLLLRCYVNVFNYNILV